MKSRIKTKQSEILGSVIKPLNTSASYTLTNDDVDKLLPFNNVATVITVNTDSIDRVGDIIYIEYEGTGDCEIQSGTAKLRTNGNDSLIAGENGRIIIQKMSATDYKVSGQLDKVF